MSDVKSDSITGTFVLTEHDLRACQRKGGDQQLYLWRRIEVPRETSERMGHCQQLKIDLGVKRTNVTGGITVMIRTKGPAGEVDIPAHEKALRIYDTSKKMFVECSGSINTPFIATFDPPQGYTKEQKQLLACTEEAMKAGISFISIEKKGSNQNVLSVQNLVFVPSHTSNQMPHPAYTMIKKMCRPHVGPKEDYATVYNEGEKVSTTNSEGDKKTISVRMEGFEAFCRDVIAKRDALMKELMRVIYLNVFLHVDMVGQVLTNDFPIVYTLTVSCTKTGIFDKSLTQQQKVPREEEEYVSGSETEVEEAASEVADDDAYSEYTRGEESDEEDAAGKVEEDAF